MRVLLFSGTSEGRELARFLSERRVETLVSVATGYGKEVMDEMPFISVRVGRRDEEGIRDLSSEFDLVIDATHPYAKEVTANIRKACFSSGVRHLRLLREEGEPGKELSDAVYSYFDNVRDAALYLKDREGRIFIATGSRDLKEYCVIPEYKERLTVRVLPAPESREICASLGIKQIIFSKGPYSFDDNIRDLKMSGAQWLVTKDSGVAGGYFEKLKAAKALGVKTLVIKRPGEPEALSLTEVKNYVNTLTEGYR